MKGGRAGGREEEGRLEEGESTISNRLLVQ